MLENRCLYLRHRPPRLRRRNCAFIEYLPPQLCHERLRRELAHEELELRPDGTIPLPRKPGLGVELDWDTVHRYRVA